MLVYVLAFFMLTGMVVTIFKTIPEEKVLKLVQGVPSEATVWKKDGATELSSVTFTVGKTEFEYTRDQPHFKEVLAVLKARKPLKVWADPAELEKGSGNKVTPYKLKANDKTVVSYQDRAKEEKDSQESSKSGAIFIAVGTAWYKRWRGNSLSSSAVRR